MTFRKIILKETVSHIGLKKKNLEEESEWNDLGYEIVP